jgi:hypothetical protein
MRSSIGEEDEQKRSWTSGGFLQEREHCERIPTVFRGRGDAPREFDDEDERKDVRAWEGDDTDSVCVGRFREVVHGPRTRSAGVER